MVSHISEGYAKLFRNVGARTDKHVREHDIYSVGYTNADGAAVRSPAERAQASSREGIRQQASATMATGTGGWLAVIEPWLNNRTIAYGTATLSVGAFALAVLLNFLGQGDLPAAPVKHEDQTAQKKSQSADKAEGPAIFGFPRFAEKKPAAGVRPAVKEEAREKKPSALAFLSVTTSPRKPRRRNRLIALAIAHGEVATATVSESGRR
jgi:hypothetical protein